MKKIFMVLLLPVVLYLSSCKDKYTIPVPTPGDTTTNNSFMTVMYGNDTFAIKDLKVNNSPFYALYARIHRNYNFTDSSWQARLEVWDYKYQKISLNMDLVNTTPIDTGDYYITMNTSTLTDYSDGQDKIYRIGLGSVVHISSAEYPITGYMNLNLYYNHAVTQATGNFKIFFK